MPRPVNADAAATKQRILDSALHLFAQRGIDGVSLRELAADARVSSAMIHHCFGGKEGLRQAAIDTMYSKLKMLSVEMMMLLAPGQNQSAGAVFDRAVVVAFQFVRNHRSAVRWLLRDVVSRGSLDSERTVTTYAPFMDAVTIRLAQLVGVEAHALRMPLHSSITLVARYRVSDESELLRLTGVEDVEEATQLVQEELRQTVRQLMRLPSN
jgi:AcrR family transcriptional regulator